MLSEIIGSVFAHFNQANNNNINREENEMPLYPDLTEPLREKLEKFAMFREFPGGDELFKKLNTQLKQFQEGRFMVNVSVAEQEIDDFANSITLVAKGEIHNITCFIELIEAYCLNEEKKQALNSRLVIKKNKLIKASEKGSFSVSDINCLNTLFSNKSSGFMLSIKEIIDRMEVEDQYQALRQFLLEEFAKFEKNDNPVVPAGIQGLISYIVYFYQSHNSFKHLLREVDFYTKQHKAMDEIELNSDLINSKEEELTSLEHVLLEKIENFVPNSEVVCSWWEDIMRTFEAFKGKLAELEEANRLTLKEALDNCKHELLEITKPSAYAFSSVLAKQEELLENIASLRAKIQPFASAEDDFNKNYQQYLVLKSQISKLLIFSSLKKPFDAFFNKKAEQQIRAIDDYRDKLIVSKNSLANEKAEIFNSIITKLQIIRDFERDTTKIDAAALAKNIKELVVAIDKNASALAMYRNTAFKSAFWCLFGMFRPQTTSIKLVKDIKEELTQFNTIIDAKIASPDLGFF